MPDPKKKTFPKKPQRKAEMRMLKEKENLRPRSITDKTSDGIKMQGKTPIMKQILSNQKGLQNMTKTEKGKKAVKNMGFTQDVDGALLMNKNYAAAMGGYKAPLKKVGDKKSDAPEGFKSDMGDFNPTITASKRTLGGSGGAPYTDSKGKVLEKDAKLPRGGKVLETSGNTKKRDKTTSQKVRVVSYKS
tara:strand:- start:6199 stop:6765 length:567 start_codon:yes stop_codon:yes gene_type:complete